MRWGLLAIMLVACSGHVDPDVDATPPACELGASCGAGVACYWYPGEGFICDGTGEVTQGGDCNRNLEAATRCAPGLLCYEDASFTKTCLAYCDPAAPACDTGTCVDLSGDGSVGVCMADPG